MLLLIFFAFIAGFVTILSPCILPILPIVLSGSLSGGHRRPIGIVTGFILSFTLFTLFLTAIVKATGISADLLRNFSVIIILLFGASLLLPNFQVIMEKLFTRLASKVSTNSSKGTGFFGGLILGVSLGLIWTPCVGPIIASVITLAATSSVNGSAFLITLAYSLGTAIPMLAITYGGRALLQKIPWLLRNTGNIQKVFGVLMILVAIGIFFNLDRKFQTAVLDAFPQYGAGLIKIEDNESVKKELEKVRDVKSTGKLEIKNGNFPMAPQLINGGQWYNSQPLKISELSGKVILIDFWTYTCINCIRTIPYLKSWYSKYEKNGLVIIGVHTPEFEFEKDINNVNEAIEDFGIKYPVMQDNDYATWSAYENKYWPAKYLIDKDGKIRYTHFGEGDYDITEKKIQELLKESGATINERVNNEDYSIDSLTPETYLGYARMKGLASPEESVHDKFSQYSIPAALKLNQFAYGGQWNIEEENSSPQKGAVLEYRFKAKDVFLVLNSIGSVAKIKVTLDGKELSKSNAGSDIINSTLTVSENKLYRIIKLEKASEHLLRLEFLDKNASAFAFTFG